MTFWRFTNRIIIIIIIYRPIINNVSATGECTCPSHMADECILRDWGDMMAMQPLAKLLLKHVISLIIIVL